MYRSAPSPRPCVVSAFHGTVAAYDRASGRTVWRWRPEGSYASTHRQPTHVVLDGNRVFVLVALRDDVGVFSSATVSAQIACLDDSTGRLLWTHTLSRGQTFPSFSGTLVVDAGQVIVSHVDVIMAISAESGQVQWSRAHEHGDGGVLLAQVELAVSGETSRPANH